MADEIPKPLKIIWLLNLIPCIIYGVLYIFFLDVIMDTGLFSQFNPVGAAAGISLGMLLLIFAIMLVRMYLLDDWAKIQFYVEFALMWIAGQAMINIWQMVALTLTATAFGLALGGFIILIVLEVVYVYYYLQLRE